MRVQSPQLAEAVYSPKQSLRFDRSTALPDPLPTFRTEGLGDASHTGLILKELNRCMMQHLPINQLAYVINAYQSQNEMHVTNMQ